jgi:hypothetical protein
MPRLARWLVYLALLYIFGSVATLHVFGSPFERCWVGYAYFRNPPTPDYCNRFEGLPSWAERWGW